MKKKATNKTTELMYKAIAKYIEEAGGLAVVIGGVSVMGVSVMKYPRDFKFNYTFCVEITGKPPIKQHV